MHTAICFVASAIDYIPALDFRDDAVANSNLLAVGFGPAVRGGRARASGHTFGWGRMVPLRWRSAGSRGNGSGRSCTPSRFMRRYRLYSRRVRRLCVLGARLGAPPAGNTHDAGHDGLGFVGAWTLVSCSRGARPRGIEPVLRTLRQRQCLCRWKLGIVPVHRYRLLAGSVVLKPRDPPHRTLARHTDSCRLTRTAEIAWESLPRLPRTCFVPGTSPCLGFPMTGQRRT